MYLAQERPRLAYIPLGHPDYVNELSRSLVMRLRIELEEAGVELLGDSGRIATSIEEVQLLIRDIAAKTECSGKAIPIDGTIIVISTWIEAPVAMAAVQSLPERSPIVIWGFPMVEVGGRKESTGSLPGFAVIKGALDRVRVQGLGTQQQFILGRPENDTAREKLFTFVRAARVFGRLKRARLGLVGYASMGMYPATFDHLLLRSRVGPEVEHVDTYSLIRRAERVTKKEALAFVDECRRTAQLAARVREEDLISSGKLGVALERLVEERKWVALTVKCQYELSQEYGMVACLPLSILAERDLVCGCEGDIPTLASMFILSVLSGDKVTYADVLDIDGDIVKFSSCGLAPFSFGAPEKKPIVTPFDLPGFSGLACGVAFKPGKITYCRLAETVGSYRLVYGVGDGMEADLRQGFLPVLDVKLPKDPERFVENLTSQHYALGYGDFRRELHTLAELLGVEAVEI